MSLIRVTLAVLLSVAVLDAAPTTAPFAFPRATPESQGVAAADIQAFLEQAEQTIDALHSVMVVRHGRVIAEGWWKPYAVGEPHMLFSLSKSFTSTAVGLAIADGKLHLEDAIVDFFPDKVPSQPSANLKAMRIRDLLTMQTGHHDEDIQNFPFTLEGSAVVRFLQVPVSHKPGTFFVYNTPATYMLSAIVQKVTGQTVLDYLRPRLFEPLGIENPSWEMSKEGVAMGGFGLSIKTEDIARFGQLYLQKGTWQGKQLVPAEWVAAATSRQVSNGSSPTSDWEQGYGYQFWRARHGFYRGDGAYGQFCLVLPQYDTVIAITSGTRDMASVMNLVWDRLVPALKPAALAPNAAADKALASKLAALTLPPQAETTPSTVASAVNGRRYAFDSNPQTIESATFEPTGDGAAVTFHMDGLDQKITASPGAWRKGTLRFKGVDDVVATTGGWTAGDTYTLKVVRYRTPFITTYRLRFAGDALDLTVDQNVGPSDSLTRSLLGHRVGQEERRKTEGSEK
jgi:CubicO group peptidase (beta-lactamase class C family)